MKLLCLQSLLQELGMVDGCLQLYRSTQGHQSQSPRPGMGKPSKTNKEDATEHIAEVIAWKGTGHCGLVFQQPVKRCICNFYRLMSSATVGSQSGHKTATEA